MKGLLPAVICCVTYAASAQVSEGELKKMMEKYHGKPPSKGITLIQPEIDTLKRSNLYAPSAGVKVKPGIYRLRQDNMPCVVPDTNDIAAIPNAVRRTTIPFKTKIPNAYRRKPVAVDKNTGK